jgi:anti-anti-sigma factor
MKIRETIRRTRVSVEEAVFVKEQDNKLYIRAAGHVTAGISATLRQRIYRRLEKPPAPEAIYVDLSSCEYMDSTFMGLLVGFTKRFEKLTGKRLELPVPSGTCAGLLENLGIHTLLEILDRPVGFPDDMENVAKTDAASTEFILRSHEDLIEISEENRKRFALLHKILKRKLEEPNESDG